MMETIIVLFVFFILIAFGFVFYSRYQRSSILEQEEQLTQQGAIEIAQRASSLPELQCSEDNVVKENCVDKFKISALSSVASTNTIFYYDLFGFSTINIRRIYPSPSSGTDCIDTIGGCNVYQNQPTSYQDILSSRIPVSINNPLNNHRELGILTIQTYS